MFNDQSSQSQPTYTYLPQVTIDGSSLTPLGSERPRVYNLSSITYEAPVAEPTDLGSSIQATEHSYPGSSRSANMISHRDMGYGYMPQAIPAYSATQSYHSTIATMPSYYDTTRHLSTSPNSSYLPNLGYSRYSISSEDREQHQRRRRRNSTERRHQQKLLSRKSSALQSTNAIQASSLSASRVPSIMGTTIDESPVETSPVDIFTTQATMQPSGYVTDHYQRAASYERSPSLRDDYRAPSIHTGYNMTQQAISSPPSYTTAYTMASLNPSMSSLVPPPMMTSPSSPHTYPIAGRSSPLLTTPLHSQGGISPHLEPVILDNRRDKPQCWDHGCNGREFSTFSNLLRHQREKSGSAAKSYCPRCGAEFTRTTARNGHMEHGKCKSRRASATGASTVSTATSQSGSVSSASGGLNAVSTAR